MFITLPTDNSDKAVRTLVQCTDIIVEPNIAQLTSKLESVTREKEESQEIITTLQTKLQEYKQQLLKTKG